MRMNIYIMKNGGRRRTITNNKIFKLSQVRRNVKYRHIMERFTFPLQLQSNVFVLLFVNRLNEKPN